jgi:carboxyl-terminal processing protease
MKRRDWLGAALAVVLTLPACGAAPTQPEEISPQARAYLEQLVGFMQGNSLHRLTIDWDAFRTGVFDQARRAQTIADTYPAIQVALGLLNDGHSSFLTPTGSRFFSPSRICSAPVVSTPTLPPTIGYVRVGGFSGSGTAAASFTTAIQNTIRAADHDSLLGWIVDVRGNTGGNMWPMIAGIGPVLGEGLAGYFIDPTGAEILWEYRDGAARLNWPRWGSAVCFRPWYSA